MVIVLLRSGGILDTHKREFIDPVDLGNFKKNLYRKISTEVNWYRTEVWYVIRDFGSKFWSYSVTWSEIFAEKR